MNPVRNVLTKVKQRGAHTMKIVFAATKDNAVFCPDCHKEMNKESSFCRYCGAKLRQSEIEAREKRAEEVKVEVLFYSTPKMMPKDILRRREKIVFEARPHMIYTLLAPWLIGAALIPIGIRVIFALVFAGVLIEIIALLVLSLSFVNWRYTIYGLTTDRVIRVRGVIGKDIYQNPLGKIQFYRLKPGFFQRKFHCGDIMISAVGTAIVEPVWKNIKRPREVQRTLRTLVQEIRKENSERA